LEQYAANPGRHQFSGDNGRIFYNRTPQQSEFEKAVDHNDLTKTEIILKEHPEFAMDRTL